MDKYFDGELLSGFEESPKTTQFVGLLNKEMDSLVDDYAKRRIADLEAKLAESENKIYELTTKLNMKEYAPVFCRLAGRECEELGTVDQLKQQLAEKDAEVQSWKDGTMVVKLGKLEGQLAEKEKEVEKLNTIIEVKDETIKHYKNWLDELKFRERNINGLIEQLPNQNQTAIDELEKVKKEFTSEVWDMYDTPDLLEQICEFRNAQIKYIDQQINNLRSK